MNKQALTPVEGIKTASRLLRGTLEESLTDEATGALAEDDTQLSKFHGFYQQDDREVRAERTRQKLEPLYSLFESFRVYLNRHKNIPEQRRVGYKNLIKFTKKLTKILPGDQKSIDRLKEEIGISKPIASIRWLTEKIAELE